MQKTLEYYNRNAREFAEGTSGVDFSGIQNRFLSHLPEGALILDFGCGSGRDTRCFLGKGFRVEAADGSEELCRLASVYTGIPVKQMLFFPFAAPAQCLTCVSSPGSIQLLYRPALVFVPAF